MNRFFYFLSVFLVSISTNAQDITTISGGKGNVNTGDGGPAIDAGIGYPSASCFDRQGNFYICTGISGNTVRKIDTNGIVTTIAGMTYEKGFGGDGGPADSAELDGPNGVGADANGNIYVSDAGNFRIRRIDHATGIITTAVGTGVSGFSGDGGLAKDAEMSSANQICFDIHGNMYFNDQLNYRIRKVDSSGIITTFAGTGDTGSSGDGGPAILAKFWGLFGICSDDRGDIFVSDDGYQTVRMIDTSGIIHLFAGNGGTGVKGDGGPAVDAEIGGAEQMGIDSHGNLFIPQFGDQVVREVTVDGIIHTVAGNGTKGFFGDGGPADSAELWDPAAVSVDACNNIYISDVSNYRVRKVTFDSTCNLHHFEAVSPVSFVSTVTIFPNPANDRIIIQSSLEKINIVNIINIDGQTVYRRSLLDTKQTSINICTFPRGIYFININGNKFSKFVKE